MTAPSSARIEDALAAAWRALGSPKRLLLAVSGGADSVALMHLAAPLRALGAALRVATVDHGLRPGSADDARFVRGAAEALGLSAALLLWEGDKPAAGVQAAARAARYRLLAREADAWRADAILTAHTADDQAETVLMRMAHRSGVRGLSGMAREVFIADGANRPQRLLRLLLGIRRAALRDYLRAAGEGFRDDPGNDDPRFERVRVRRMLAASPRGEEATGAVFAMAEDSRRMTVLLDRFDTVRLGVLEAEFLGDGSVRVSAQKISPRHDGALAARLFGAVGAGEAPADDAAAAALAGALDGRRATLSGALVAGVGRDLFFMREPAAVLGRRGEQGAAPIPLAPGARCLWDRRFTVENSLGAAAEVRPLGAASRALKSGPIEALATAPGLWRGGELAAFPGDDGLGDASISCLTAERFHRRVVRH